MKQKPLQAGDLVTSGMLTGAIVKLALQHAGLATQQLHQLADRHPRWIAMWVHYLITDTYSYRSQTCTQLPQGGLHRQTHNP